MAEKVQRIANIINRVASPRLAEKWDNVGLLVGDYTADVEKVMVTLDVNQDVLESAIEQGVNMIISHHPMIFSKIKSIRADRPKGKMIIDAIKNDLNIFAAHTNLDIAEGGINDLLAQRLNLEKVEPLTINSSEDLFKLVVYIPAGHEEELRMAISEEGAGWIGKYSHCTFQTSGTGTFKPMEGTDPFIGRHGELEKVKEVRLETIVPASRLNKVIRTMVKVHPYEEVAYDIYPLKNSGKVYGLGRVGYLQEEKPYQDVIDMIKDKLELDSLRYMGDLGESIKKIAICSGSGADYIQNAAFKGADLYLTGDIKLHDAQLAESLGLSLIDAGHYGTEVICVPYLYTLLKDEIEEKSLDFEVIQYNKSTDPLKLY